MKIEEKPIDSVSCYEFNNRIHTASQVELIARSIKEFGFNQPIVVDEKNTILVGHGRYLAAKSLGHKTIPCVQLTNLTQQQKAAYRILDNKLQNDSTWDFNNLELELGNLEDEGFNLESWGLDALLEMIAPEEEPQATDDNFDPTTKAESPIKRGDLIELNNHRVLCGDSTSEEDVATLMDDNLADMILTDPPYGVSYVGKTKDALVIENDNLNEEELAGFVKQVFDRAEAVSRPGSYWYATVPAGPLFSVFLLDWKSRGILRQSMVWIKDTMVLGHSEYHYQHEPIIFGWKEGKRHVNDDRTRTTVWQVDRPKKNKEHPTMKPVELWARAIKDGSRQGEIILDQFLGSGTTLIAADQLQRTCYGMEISPQYVDVIIRRYIKHRASVNKPCSVRINGMEVKDYDKY